MNNSPLVTIGVPCYNRPANLRLTLECCIHQTYKNLDILVSDNCSPNPDVEKVILEFIEKDKRVRYIKQAENRGLVANMRYVLDGASGDYFMWLHDDDELDLNYIEVCLDGLINSKNCKMAFSNILDIDTFGRTIRYYPSYSRFKCKSRLILVFKYIMEPEVMGKANMMFSLFDTAFCRQIWDLIYSGKTEFPWGSDNALTLAALIRTDFALVKNVYIKKRYSRWNDREDKANFIKIKYPIFGVFPISESIPYILSLLRACHQIRYVFLVYFLMILRIPVSLFSSYLKSLLIVLDIYKKERADNSGAY